MNILHVFDRYDKVADYIGDMRCVGDVLVKHRSSRIIVGDMLMDFRVIVDERDWLAIAGCCYQIVFYHYNAPQEVRNFVLSRIRG